MKSLRIILALVVVAMCCGWVSAYAQQNQATTSANAGATIITAIGISKTADLDFGDVVAGATLGTVVITPAGARSATGGVTLGNTGATTAAGFTVTGDPNATYAITLPSSCVISYNSDNMTIDTFTSTPSGTGTLSGGGSQTLAVGATLHVAATQANGVYSGSFDVTVAYN